MDDLDQPTAPTFSDLAGSDDVSAKFSSFYTHPHSMRTKRITLDALAEDVLRA